MPRLVDKKQKAERIGSAAIGVFRQLGYHGTRMADIARAAGVGKGTLYEYFRNKDEIFRFEFERYFKAFQSGAAAATAAAGSPGGRLLALVDFAFGHIAEWEDHCGVYVDYFGSGRSGDDAAFSLSGIYAEIEGTLRRLIEEAQSSGEIDREIESGATAELLVSVFDGVVLHGVFAERRCKPESLRAAALRLLRGGIFASPRVERSSASDVDEPVGRSR